MDATQSNADVSPRASDYRISPASSRMAMLALIPTAVAFSLAIATVVRVTKLPLYLDCIGCMVTTILCGFWPGAVAGVLAQVASVFLGSGFDFLFYTGTVVAVGFATHICGKLGGFKYFWRTIVSGLVIGLVSIACSTPITCWRGGVTSAGSTFVTALWLVKGHPLVQSVIYSGITCDLPDKIVSSFISIWLIRSVPRDLLRRFHGGTLEKNVKL